jgi:hypothetical protein
MLRVSRRQAPAAFFGRHGRLAAACWPAASRQQMTPSLKRLLLVLLSVAACLAAGSAYADCANPPGKESAMKTGAGRFANTAHHLPSSFGSFSHHEHGCGPKPGYRNRNAKVCARHAVPTMTSKE